MKVLIIDMYGCRFPDLGYQIKSTFESLGHEAKSFDYRKWKLQHLNVSNKLLNKLMIRSAKSFNADLVIVNKGESILPGTINAMKKLGIKTANWNPDEPFGDIQAFNRIKNVEEYDAFFTYDLQYLEPLKAKNLNSYYLPPGAHVAVHKEQIPIDERKYPADLCMVGTAYQNRINLLMPFANRTMRLAGPGWDKAPQELASKALPPVKITEMVKLFNESKIVLNPYGASKSFICPNPRTFEIPGSRNFELTDAPRDVERFFELGKEIVVYHDEKEFKELVDYYLEHDEERIKIAKAGYERVMKEHTMTHRVSELLDVMGLK